MKRSPLTRKKPLVRKGWMAASRRVTKFTKYRRRPRDRAYMQWIRLQPCAARVFSHLSHCAGPVEADHAGRRGMRQKAPDRTCIPMCRQHHRERHDFAGAFRDVGRAAMRYWLDFQITWHQAEYDLQQERARG